MSQKKYQKLQAKNMLAANRLYDVLKSQKCMSYETMAQTYQRATQCHRSGSFNNLIKTTLDFMLDHDLMTISLINGLLIYSATQKCFRTKNFKNATKEVQVITNALIDKAISYVEINDGSVPPEFEAPIVANILGLEGKTRKFFIETYEYSFEVTPTYLERKYTVIGPVMCLMSEGSLKKV